MTSKVNQSSGITRKGFLAGIGASAMAKWGMAAEPVTDWRPAERWRGFNILGMFRCPTNGLKPDPRVDGHFVEWEFKALHDWGFNFARLPLDYRILIAGDSWTNLSEQKMKHLDAAVRWGRQYGIHVQIALHRIPGYCILDQTEAFPLGTSPVAQEAACKMWATFAKRWKGIPNEALSFNLFNEPTRHTAGANYLPLCRKLIAAIRNEDGERFKLGETEITYLYTPGHTSGCGVYLFDDIMISGDTLFCESYGRTDLPSGNDAQMIQSLKRLKELDGDYQVIPGHGPMTTLSHERRFNPLMRRL